MHYSMFIAGSCLDPETGVVDSQKLQKNLDIAIDAYISRVDGAPCGNTPIHLYKGAMDSDDVKSRESLLSISKYPSCHMS